MKSSMPKTTTTRGSKTELSTSQLMVLFFIYTTLHKDHPKTITIQNSNTSHNYKTNRKFSFRTRAENRAYRHYNFSRNFTPSPHFCSYHHQNQTNNNKNHSPKQFFFCNGKYRRLQLLQQTPNSSIAT
jgi:hypothetical protein